MHSSYVILDDGSRIEFSQLLEMVPCTILATYDFVSICKSVSLARNFELLDLNKIYVNLLIKHSKFTAQITALYFLHKNGILPIRSIHSDFNLEVVKKFFPDIDLKGSESESDNYIDSKHRYIFLVKSLMHRFYRILSSGRRIVARDVSIRSWVEISEVMFSEHYKGGNILIYPFFLNFKRHVKYIRSVYKRFESVSFMGLPYRIFPALKNVLVCSDNFYVMEEFYAYHKHAQELSLITNLSLKTSDEFEAGSFVMSGVLKDNCISVENKAHGISFACPYTNYSSFLVYNKAQQAYYALNSLDTEFRIFERRNAPKTDAVKASAIFSPAIVAIYNPYARVGLKFEHLLQEKIFNTLDEFCTSRGMPFYIKKHPNSISSDLQYLESWKVATKIFSLSELRYSNPVFINISSVSYYDFKDYGPFIFVDDGIVPIDVMFGSDIVSVKLSELDKLLPRYFEESYWHQAKNNN